MKSIEWQLKELPLKLLDNPSLDFRSFRSASFKSVLKSSLVNVPFFDPLKVRTKLNGRYEILDGVTRKEDLLELGFKRVLCLVASCDHDTALAIQVHSAYTRRRLDVIGLARYFALQRRAKKKLNEIGEPFGIKKAQVSKILALLKLSDYDQNRVARGELSINDGYRFVKKQWRREQRLKIEEPTQKACVYCGERVDPQFFRRVEFCPACEERLIGAIKRDRDLRKREAKPFDQRTL